MGGNLRDTGITSANITDMNATHNIPLQTHNWAYWLNFQGGSSGIPGIGFQKKNTYGVDNPEISVIFATDLIRNGFIAPDRFALPVNIAAHGVVGEDTMGATRNGLQVDLR